MKWLKTIKGKNEEQLKAIKVQGEKQLKILSEDKIKAPLLNSIYNKELNKRIIDIDDAIRIFKSLENLLLLITIEIDYTNLVHKSGGNVYFDFGKYGHCLVFIWNW